MSSGVGMAPSPFPAPHPCICAMRAQRWIATWGTVLPPPLLPPCPMDKVWRRCCLPFLPPFLPCVCKTGHPTDEGELYEPQPPPQIAQRQSGVFGAARTGAGMQAVRQAPLCLCVGVPCKQGPHRNGLAPIHPTPMHAQRGHVNGGHAHPEDNT
jgi:hypothetical protein